MVLVDLNDNNHKYTFGHLTFDLHGNESNTDKDIFYGNNITHMSDFYIEGGISFQDGHTYELQWKDSSNTSNIFKMDTTPSSDTYVFKGFKWVGSHLQYKCVLSKTYDIDIHDMTEAVPNGITGFTFNYKITINEQTALSDEERRLIRDYIYENINPALSSTNYISLSRIDSVSDPVTFCSKYENNKIKEGDYDIITNKTDIKYSGTYFNPNDETLLNNIDSAGKLFIKIAPIVNIIINNFSSIKIGKITYNLKTTEINPNLDEAYEYTGIDGQFERDY